MSELARQVVSSAQDLALEGTRRRPGRRRPTRRRSHQRSRVAAVHRPQLRERTGAAEFSSSTCNPVAFASMSRKSTSRQPSVGACSTASRAVRPCRAPRCRSRCIHRFAGGRRGLLTVRKRVTLRSRITDVGSVTTPPIGLPRRSASMSSVWLMRMSMAITAVAGCRCRETSVCGREWRHRWRLRR